jgi:hypothetical protein
MTEAAWSCASCGYVNGAGATCERCGVARSYLDDPPLDLPYPPRLSELAGFFGFLLWSVPAAAGVVLLLTPAWRAALGLGPVFLAVQAASAAAAAATSLTDALWERLFNEIKLDVPQTVKSGDTFDAVLRLVPYDHVADVRVAVALVDNFYQREEQGSVQTRTRRLERQVPLWGEGLSGRHQHDLTARFVAPFPATSHSDIIADVMASLFGALAWAVPGLGLAAHNLREHGGYYVQATVRVGLLRRTLKRRVIAYYVGKDLFVG